MRRLSISVLLPLLVACRGGGDTAVTQLHPAPDCVVTAKACVANAKGLHVGLRLPPTPEPLKPFQARVNITGAAIDTPVLELSMVGMDMGDNRYRFVPDGADTWTATVVLPVCTLGRADWMADVTFSAEGTRYRARFPFSTGG